MSKNQQGRRPERNGRPPRVSDQRWLELQALWEREPKEDHGTIAKRAGVSRERVRQKAIEMGWQRRADLQHVVQVAHLKADAHFLPAQAPGEDVQQAPAAARPPEGPSARVEAAADERSAELRADITIRHRNEWRVVRGLLQEAVQKRDMPKAKLAKVTAETLKITQDGERKAWGMDAPEAAGGAGTATVKVVIEREEVGRTA
jgi:hypothetical protein